MLVLKDNRFQVVGKVTLGLVCFRLKVSFSSAPSPLSLLLSLHHFIGTTPSDKHGAIEI